MSLKFEHVLLNNMLSLENAKQQLIFSGNWTKTKPLWESFKVFEFLSHESKV